MGVENKYKNDVTQNYQSTSTYDDIRDRVRVKRKVFNFKPLIAFAGAAAVIAVGIGVFGNFNSSATGALAYQISPEVSKQIAVQQASAMPLAPLKAISPLMKKDADTEEKENIEDIIYKVDALISNENTCKIKDVDSDREDFANAQEISYTLLNGTKSTYTLYYNDVTSSSNEKKNKSSFEKSFEGIAVSNNIELTFTFESKEETKNNKSNYASITTIFENDSKTDYLVISSESETKKNKEQESYKYEHFSNKTIDNTYSISYNAKKSKQDVKVVTESEAYVVSKKVTDKKEMFSVKIDSAEGVEKYSFKKVIEDTGAVEYEEVQE